MSLFTIYAIRALAIDVSLRVIQTLNDLRPMGIRKSGVWDPEVRGSVGPGIQGSRGLDFFPGYLAFILRFAFQFFARFY